MTAATLLLLLGAITSWLSLQIRVGTLHAPGSGFFPFYLGLLLIILAAVHLTRLRRASQNTSGVDADGASPGSWQRVLLFLGATVLVTGLFTVLGYAVAAFLLMALLLYILGTRRWLEIVIIALCAAGASYALFVRWLQIPLPTGFGL